MDKAQSGHGRWNAVATAALTAVPHSLPGTFWKRQGDPRLRDGRVYGVTLGFDRSTSSGRINWKGGAWQPDAGDIDQAFKCWTRLGMYSCHEKLTCPSPLVYTLMSFCP